VAFFDSNGPFRGQKYTLNEGAIRIPFIANWPGRIPSGVVNTYVGASWDVLPTIADIAGVKPPSGIDGVSLYPTLIGGAGQVQHANLYWEFEENGSAFLQAMRQGNWKGIYSNSQLKLYDLSSDQGESNDVAAANPTVASQMITAMQASRQPGPVTATNAVAGVVGNVTGSGNTYSINFGTIPLNGGWANKTFRVKNYAAGYSRLMKGSISSASLTDSRLVLTPPGTGAAYGSLVSGETSAVFKITFKPTQLGPLQNQNIPVRGFWSYDGISPVVNQPVTIQVLGEVVP
jgi:hypothetical protein